MAQFQNKNYKKRDFLYSRPALIALGVLIIFFAYKLYALIGKSIEARHNKSAVLQQIETLHNRETELSTDISKLKTPEGIEEVIREKFRVVKEGEGVVMIVDEDKPKEAPKQNIFKRIFHGKADDQSSSQD